MRKSVVVLMLVGLLGGSALLSVSNAGGAVSPSSGTFKGSTDQFYFQFDTSRQGFHKTSKHQPFSMKVSGGKVRRIKLVLNIDEMASPDCGGMDLPLSRSYSASIKNGHFSIHDKRKSDVLLDRSGGNRPNDLRVEGRFTASRKAKGTITDTLTSLAGPCDSGTIHWTAKL